MSDQIGFTLRDGAELAGVDLEDLWWRYAAIGGNGDQLSLASRLMGVLPCGPGEHDLIAQALNETFIDQGIDTFPVAYCDPLPQPMPLPGRSVQAGTAGRSMQAGSAGRSMQARHDAAGARLRSAAAARKAATLHATAAQLMQASGQLQFARHARDRARIAQQRGAAWTAA